MDRKKEIGKAIIGSLIATVLYTTATLLLWNALLPDLFGLPYLSCWEALGLFLLSRMLFGGLGWGRMYAFGAMIHKKENHIRDKWMKMSEEERREFINHRLSSRGFPGVYPFRKQEGSEDE